MRYLPPEIESMIIEPFLDDLVSRERWCNTRVGQQQRYAGYALLGRTWHYLVDQVIFRKLYLTPSRIAYALKHNILTPRRLSFLRHIDVEFKVPEHEIDSDDFFLRTTEENNALFTEMTVGLFRLLAPSPVADKPTLVIHLSVPYPKKVWTWDPNAEENQVWTQQRAERRLLRAGRFQESYMELDQAVCESLPELPNVSLFEAGFVSSVALLMSPLSCVTMASKMTRLSWTSFQFSDDEKRDEDLRLRFRTELAENLESLPDTVEHFILNYKRMGPRDHCYEPPSIVPEGSVDKLSHALYLFSQRPPLKTFSVAASVDTTILWPDEDLDEDQKPHFPSMLKYDVSMCDVTPSGRWLLVGHQEPDIEDGFYDYPEDAEIVVPSIEAPITTPPSPAPVNPFGDIPGEGRVNRFRNLSDVWERERLWVKAGKCAAQMPKLRTFKVNTDVTFEPQPTNRRSRPIEDTPTIILRGEPPPIPTHPTVVLWHETADKRGVRFALDLESETAAIRRIDYPGPDWAALEPYFTWTGTYIAGHPELAGGFINNPPGWLAELLNNPPPWVVEFLTGQPVGAGQFLNAPPPWTGPLINGPPAGTGE